MTKVFLIWGKKAIFLEKIVAPSKKVIALNMYIGTNVLMYERWLVLKVWYMAARLSPFHRLTLLMHVSQKLACQKRAGKCIGNYHGSFWCVEQYIASKIGYTTKTFSYGLHLKWFCTWSRGGIEHITIYNRASLILCLYEVLFYITSISL